VCSCRSVRVCHRDDRSLRLTLVALSVAPNLVEEKSRLIRVKKKMSRVILLSIVVAVVAVLAGVQAHEQGQRAHREWCNALRAKVC
jgi:hypothetical protein